MAVTFQFYFYNEENPSVFTVRKSVFPHSSEFFITVIFATLLQFFSITLAHFLKYTHPS